ncbi:hypothetical protein HOP62_02215 [Halomonas sp. MCCC 1A17488]|uniref:Transcriptional activator HlyU n=1 Tax=Billgrantia sulfidoxydans TaxID=2733484 RepID=A0ABX7W532_9GAMM|nr:MULTISPECIES: HlyU family transcriptional regulator [Halomonas]MCE8014888.1 hypothetical protein [Halomonas sp. MCCC 1A17488]MCG3238221.1 hypothetical protein [Halomonas sp. MCCC 1A17488]QPP48015.1 hypothetical protein I4484_12185 [Halomonas sp. SS10-MC5]QTP55323.1 hypothetical protein HNO51_11900 [Halomonas sulfidoxydans]
MLKKLLGGLFGSGGDAKPGNAKAAEPVEYHGYQIVSEPAEQGGQYRVSGWIRKPGENGETLEHRFERSDLVPGRDACDQLMVSKAQRYIDQVGDDMFQPR